MCMSVVMALFEVITASIIAETVVNDGYIVRIHDSGAEFRCNFDAIAVYGQSIHERAYLTACEVICTCCTLDHADFVIFERRSIDGCQKMIECARLHAVNSRIMRWRGRGGYMHGRCGRLCDRCWWWRRHNGLAMIAVIVFFVFLLGIRFFGGLFPVRCRLDNAWRRAGLR